MHVEDDFYEEDLQADKYINKKDAQNKKKYLNKNKKIKESFTFGDLLSEEDKDKLKNML